MSNSKVDDTQEKTGEQKMIYSVDGKNYDATLLPDEAKQALGLLIEIDKVQKELNKQRAIYGAAVAQLNTVINNNLTKEALIKKEEEGPQTGEIGGRAD